MSDILVAVVGAIVGSLVWTLVLRMFPSVLTAKLTKGIEHGYDTKLSQFKADLAARYSTLKSSVDFLSAS